MKRPKAKRVRVLSGFAAVIKETNQYRFGKGWKSGEHASAAMGLNVFFSRGDAEEWAFWSVRPCRIVRVSVRDLTRPAKRKEKKHG